VANLETPGLVESVMDAENGKAYNILSRLLQERQAFEWEE